jgi:chromosome segregation ATPase
VAQARAAYEREKKEADAISVLSRQRLAAAEQIEKQGAAETDPNRKAALEKSLGTLVAMLEEMAPEIEREETEAKDAQDFLQMLEQAYANAGAKLKRARNDLERAQRDMSRADQQRQAAEQRAEAARQAAGLASATSGLSIALKSMQDVAARDMASADAASAKARLLRPTKPEEDDPNIAEALRLASGTSPAPTNLTDRLAAIRGRQ